MSRAEEAAQRAALAAAREQAESRQAQRLIEDFLRQARERGLTPEPLRATLYGGASVRTDKTGWYLRRNHSIGVGADGGYYVLTVPGGWRARFSGVTLQPSPPPLEVGRGGRDGETGDLRTFLDRVLNGTAGG